MDPVAAVDEDRIEIAERLGADVGLEERAEIDGRTDGLFDVADGDARDGDQRRGPGAGGVAGAFGTGGAEDQKETGGAHPRASTRKRLQTQPLRVKSFHCNFFS